MIITFFSSFWHSLAIGLRLKEEWRFPLLRPSQPDSFIHSLKSQGHLILGRLQMMNVVGRVGSRLGRNIASTLQREVGTVKN